MARMEDSDVDDANVFSKIRGLSINFLRNEDSRDMLNASSWSYN